MVSVAFALAQNDDKLDDFDIDYLCGLCFNSTKVVRQPASAGESSFIRGCCERGSLLSLPLSGKHGRVQDITKETDFTNIRT